MVLQVRSWHDKQTDAKERFYYFDMITMNQKFDPTFKEGKKFIATTRDIIRRCDTIVMVACPWDHPVVLSRAWCIFELARAVTEQTKLELVPPPPEKLKFETTVLKDTKTIERVMNNVFFKIDTKQAKTTYASDKKTITKFIMEDPGGYDRVDEIVRPALREWLCQVQNKQHSNTK